MQPAPGRNRGNAIAWILRAPVLRLQQIDIAAARDVKRMSCRAEKTIAIPFQRLAAVANGAEEHGSSVADRDIRSDGMRIAAHYIDARKSPHGRTR